VRGPVTPAVDKAEIRRIAGETREKFERERKRCLELIRWCDDGIKAAAELPSINRDQLQQQRADLQRRANAITWHLKRQVFWQRMALLLAAERAGIHLGYTSADVPSGPCIDYLMQASAQMERPISAWSARRLIKAFQRTFMKATFAGSGSLTANAQVVRPALWFWA
jgi:hypothetical protein